MPIESVLKSIFIESRRLSRLGYRTWYTKANDLAQFYGLDITNAGDASASNQVIRNNIEGHFIADWKDKMQDTAQFPILLTYKLFKQNFNCESYLHLIKKIVSIELHLLNFELVVTIERSSGGVTQTQFEAKCLKSSASISLI